MSMTGLQKKCSKQAKVIIISSMCIVMLLGCSKSNVESPNNPNSIWGFGNVVKDESNTFESNTASIADNTSFTYMDQIRFSQIVKEALSTPYQGVYQSNYQQEVLAQMISLKTKKTYTMDNPLFIQNPFGTNSSSLYVYFGTPSQRIILHYTVSASDSTIPDFSDTMYIDSTNTTDMEGQIIGLVSGQQNKIVLDVRDEAGNKICKKAYIIAVPVKESTVAQRLQVETSGEMEYTRGLFTYLINEKQSGYYVFYDNNGILRGEISTYVNQPNAKIVQVDNQIFYEYDDNQFALVNNIGFVLRSYSYENGENIIDYDYDVENKRILAIAEDDTTKNRDKIYSLDLNSGDWSLLVDFSNILQNTEIVEEKEGLVDDWLGLNYINIVKGKDIIVLSQKLNTIFRINNIYDQPVIRWIIGNESQWKNTKYESLLLTKIGDTNPLKSIDSLTYTTSKKLKENQIYLSFINFANELENASNVIFDKYLVDENSNRYRIQQSIDIATSGSSCSAIGYGAHAVIALWNHQIIIEYNTKGEIMLRMTLPNNNFSNRIYKYTMDRYWF